MVKAAVKGLFPLWRDQAYLVYNALAAMGYPLMYGSLSDDKKVMQFAWKDQNVVLFMSTVSNGRDSVKRPRRRPAKTATNARTSRAIFGEMTTKELDIPAFIDMYNHYMNGVDNADQLRYYYNTQRVHLKSWKSLWHFLLDTTIVNAYKMPIASLKSLTKALIETFAYD